VHVDHLVRELSRNRNGGHRLEVLCFGDQHERDLKRTVNGIGPVEAMSAAALRHAGLLNDLARNIVMAGLAESADVVHCHTWYTHLAGCLIKQLLQIPLVVTTHSLEPHRPWKQEQLGNGYFAAAWLEKTALGNADGIIAVSRAMKDDILELYDVPGEKVHVIHNGIDTERYCRTPNPAVLESYGIDPNRPMVLFVGRITRQKGILHLLSALGWVKRACQVVLCAGAADTQAIAGQVEDAVAAVRNDTPNPLVWIREMVPVDRLIALYSHASVFVCPSVYEPFGIINLEAMACSTPVVASAVGGIPEVVVHGDTGLLVPFEASGPGNAEPKHPRQFAQDLAAAIDKLVASPETCAAMGMAARRRVEAHFSWRQIARRTLEVYEQLRTESRIKGSGS
jgi:glycogen synthase